MGEAVRLAHLARPHPNPQVGAVLVKDGSVIGSGFHTGPGAAHAEIEALADVGEAARGATMYVTLEPCSHHGRTPPCADALIAAGVASVIVGEADPDARVSGRGVARLREAGVEVIDGLLDESVDPAYMFHRRTGRAMTTLKSAITLDGQLAAADGSSQWITSQQARRHGHELRAKVDAILVGAGTVIADDPLLTVRLPDYTGPQPRPIVVAGARPIPSDRRIWERDPLVLSSGPWTGRGTALPVAGDDSHVDLKAALVALSEHGYLDVLVEGGSALSGALWRRGLVDRGVFYVGAKVAGGVGIGPFDGTFATLADARSVDITAIHQIGPDVVIEFITE